MKIQHAEEKDCDSVSSIIGKTISDIYPRYYPLGVVNFFLAYHSKDKVRNAILNKELYLIREGDIIVGTGSIKNNEPGRLFILPEYQRQGYGRYLMDFLEQVILEKNNLITLDASLPAMHFYIQRGYKPISFESKTTDSGDVLCYSVMAFTK